MIDGRGGPRWGFIAKTGDPERALCNLLERDAMFTERLYDEAQGLAARQAKRARGLPLPLADRLDARADDLGDEGASVDGQAQHERHEFRLHRQPAGRAA